MTVCIPQKNIVLIVPEFFPCTAKELPAKMAALAEHIENIEQLPAERKCRK